MSILTAQEFFSNSVYQASGGATVRRVPFTFTSTARLLKAGKLDAIGNKFSSLIADENRLGQLAAIEAETRGIEATQQLGVSPIENQDNKTDRVGTSSSIIQMAINPQSIAWRQNKRISKRDTMEGSVYFHFTNSQNQNNDILTLSFQGKTGNINTQNPTDATVTGANQKLRIWHELYNLTREPILLDKNNTGKNIPFGIKNEFFITYRTALIPVQITLVGFFSKVLEFTETANDPFNRDYSFDFTVVHTSPSLDDLVTQVNTRLTDVTPSQSLGSKITAIASGGTIIKPGI